MYIIEEEPYMYCLIFDHAESYSTSRGIVLRHQMSWLYADIFSGHLIKETCHETSLKGTVSRDPKLRVKLTACKNILCNFKITPGNMDILVLSHLCLEIGKHAA